MGERKSLPKSLRFEVFKRDKFTCQYCGAKAPDVVLQVDHIHPVADGGTDELLNLVTSCAGCNGGKGARLLSDNSVVDLQRKQIEELQDRRDQLEMLLAWRNEVRSVDDDIVEMINSHIGRRGGGWVLNENGKSDLRRLLKRHPTEDVLAGIDASFEKNLRWAGENVDQASWETAWRKVPAFIRMHIAAKERPYLPALGYVQGILRNRLDNKWLRCMEALEEMHLEGMPIDEMTRIAKRSDDWEEFCGAVDSYLAGMRDR